MTLSCREGNDHLCFGNCHQVKRGGRFPDSPVPSRPRTEWLGGYTHLKTEVVWAGLWLSVQPGQRWFCSFSTARSNPAAQGKAQRWTWTWKVIDRETHCIICTESLSWLWQLSKKELGSCSKRRFIVNLGKKQLFVWEKIVRGQPAPEI